MSSEPDIFASLCEQAQAIAAGRLSAKRAVASALERIRTLDGTINAFTQVFEERAREQAAAIDRRLRAGEAVGPLAGVPVALKDNICLDHGRTTCASRMLESYESPFSATAAERLIAAGAVIVGKTNMDEFGMGSSTERSIFGPTRNPWDPSRVAGGSSGGSAAAVATGMVAGALGSDTGGSVRQPAALCGVVGLKPTYGRVSRWGLVAYASSLDQIGPITRDVRDAALLLQVIAGADERDSTCHASSAPDLLGEIERPIEGLRVGAPRQARCGANHPDVAAAFERALETLRAAGAEIVDIELPHLEYGVPAYYIVAPAEASSNLARFDGVRYGRRASPAPGEGVEELYARSRAEGFGPEVQRRIMLGTYVLSSGYYDAYYLTALKARRRIKEDFDRAFGAGCHVIATPSTVNPAFELGSRADDALSMYLEDLYTVTANLAGLPAISLPAGYASVGGSTLPLGLQLMAPAFAEGGLLRAARMFERATEGERRWPGG